MKNVSRDIVLFLCIVCPIQYLQAAPIKSIQKTSAQIEHTAKRINNITEYVGRLIDNGYNIFHDKTISETEKTAKITKLISSHLYLDWMAKYTLGRHRRTLSKEKINEFCKVYSQFVITSYTDLSVTYGGRKAILKKIRKIDDNMFIVNMEIARPNGQQSIKMDYLVHQISNNIKDTYQIADIITEGISILNSQQAEFNSVISNQGIDALINDLRSRINYKKNQNTI